MKILNIVRRIIIQIFNDKRSLVLILFAPIFIITLIYLLLGKSDYKAHIVQNGIPSAIVTKLRDEGVTVDGVAIHDGRQQVKDNKTDALFYKDSSGMKLLFNSNDAVKTGVVMQDIQDAIKSLNSSSVLNTEYIYGSSGDSLFDNLGFVMLGIISFFIVFIIAGISFVRERTTQTMERMMMTPVRRWQVVTGYTLGFGFFAVLQSVLLLSFVIWVLKMPMRGSAPAAALIMILLSLSSVCMGAFFSLFSNNEFQIMQFIPVVVIPQIFFSGLISLDTIPYHLGLLSKIMPVFYACDALKAVTIMGKGLSSVWPDIVALLIFTAVFSFMNITALKKYRRI